jgi:hypothetical protein
MTEPNQRADLAPRVERGGPRRLFYFLAALAALVYTFRFFVYAYYDRDHLNNGFPAAALVDRFPAPMSQFQFGQSHGLFVYGALLTPVYYWAGSRLLWIKFVGVLFAAAGLFFWTLNIRRAFGRTAAVFFLLFCIVPPPSFEWSIHCAFWGNHLESIFFSGLLFYLFLRLRDFPGFVSNSLFWLLAGFAAFFCKQNLSLAAALAIGFVWRWKWRGVVRLLLPGAVFFGAAYLCLLPGLRLQEVNVTDLHAMGGSLARLFVNRLPRLAQYDVFRAPPLGRMFGGWRDFRAFGCPVGSLLNYPLLSFLFLAAAAAGIAAIFPVALSAGDREWLEFAFLLLFQLLFWCVGYMVFTAGVEAAGDGSTDFFGVRYFLPIFPILLAFVCVRLSSWPRLAQWAIAAPLLFAGALHAVTYFPVDQVRFGEQWRELANRRGDDYVEMIGPHLDWPGDWAAATEIVAKLPLAWRDFGWVAFGRRYGSEEHSDEIFADPSLSHAQKALIATGWGEWLGVAESAASAAGSSDWLVFARRASPTANRLDAALAARFAEGLGVGETERLVQGERRTLDRITRPSRQPAAEDCEPSAALRVLRELTPQLGATEFFTAFFKGAGFGLWRFGLGLCEYSLWNASGAAAWTSESTNRYAHYWSCGFGIEDTPVALRSFWAGYAEGRAEFIRRNYR